ncbi:unnamed protein product, partial [Mesorhabditis spiculigera]
MTSATTGNHDRNGDIEMLAFPPQTVGTAQVPDVDREVEVLHSDIEEKKYEQQDATVQESIRLEWDKRCYFPDAKRQIDYVLAYEDDVEFTDSCDSPTLDSSDEEDSNKPNTTQNPANGGFMSWKRKKKAQIQLEKKSTRRRKFLENLETMGLNLEHCQAELGNTKYVLVHAPFELLEKQAQLLTVKLPVKRSDVDMEERNILPGFVDRLLNRLKIFEFDEHTNQLLNEPEYFTAPYSSDRRKQFVNWDRPDLLFPNAERCRMVYDLLIRARYDSLINAPEAHFRVGIERLLANGTFSAAYPLHQEFRSRSEIKDEDRTQRELLYTHWASWRNFCKYQPLDLVKRYFGTKVGLYFAWLGYYTRALYPAALIGLLSLMFGIYHVTGDDVSNDICNDDGIGGREWVCPHCVSHACNYQKLQGSCLYSKVSFLFDNTSTVIFAVCMSIWATLFLEGWKRYHAEVAWKWGLVDFVIEEETVRPEFQLRVKTKRFNPITQQEEPYLSMEKKTKNIFASGATVLFFICLVLAVVFGMVVYRVIAYEFLNSRDNADLDQFSFIIVSVTAATLNMFVILPMNMFYNKLAHWLTRWECPRTQADFDNQYTFKVFLFQFVNYYSSLFYIAFFKGAFTANPKHAYYGLTLEGCDSAGCFAELVIQLIIIMCGKQFFSAFMETLYPKIMSKIREYRFIVRGEESKRERMEREAQKRRLSRSRSTRTRGGYSSLRFAIQQKLSRWETDYYLSPVYDQFLFDEYLEMVLQFGFVTLFVAAFPLAPLFAVLNNIMEIRLDAYKFLVHVQRPLPALAKNIGIWLPILDGISKCSVTINALVIAFTSDFVPRTYYFFTHGYDMAGYVDYSLAYFNTTHFPEKTMGAFYASAQNVTMCRYRGFFRHPCAGPNDTTLYNNELCSDDYARSQEWWHIFAYRLLFVVLFEHLVFVLKGLIAYLIPDIPTKIFIQQQREKYLARQALIAQGIASGNQHNENDSEATAYQPGSDLKPPKGVATVQTFATNPANPTTVVQFAPIIAHRRSTTSEGPLRSTPSNESFVTAQYGSNHDINAQNDKF